MRLSQYEIINKSIIVLGICGLLLACEQNRELVPLDSFSSSTAVSYKVDVNFCTPPAETQKLKVKTVIILDHSGSNGENYRMDPSGSGAPALPLEVDPIYATDPLGLTRYGTPDTPGTLLNYLSTLPANDPANPDFYFSVVNFANGAQTFPTNQTFTSNIEGFYNQILEDSNAGGAGPADTGGTSYKSALTTASRIINNDIQSSKNCAGRSPTATPTPDCPKPGVATPSNYVVIFMSDGSPILQIVPTTPIQVERESTREILSLVRDLSALQEDTRFVAGVNLFTIYYYIPGNEDDNGRALLAQMAEKGNGLFYNTVAGSNIDYNQFQPPTKRIQYDLEDVFVTNASTVWDRSGVLQRDSDGDGLSDLIERQWGTNPNLRSTANNGISDFVRYQLSGGASCNNKNAAGLCTDPVPRYENGACSGIRTFSSGGRFMFHSSDPSGLNDCEKILLNNQAGIGMPDSNSDNIPDWIEFLHGIPFQVGTSPAVTEVHQDGYTTYEKIKFSMPVQTNAGMSSDLKPARYNLSKTVSNEEQTCYNLEVTDFPVVGAADTVRVDLLLKSNISNLGSIYKVGLKPFQPQSEILVIQDWNNADEQALGTWESLP